MGFVGESGSWDVVGGAGTVPFHFVSVDRGWQGIDTKDGSTLANSNSKDCAWYFRPPGSIDLGIIPFLGLAIICMT